MAAQEQAEVREQLLTFDDFRAQGETVEGLLRTLKDGTYVHAYLISGAKGVGKRSLAMLMAQYLLCTCESEDQGLLADLPGLPPAKRPCGHCAGCVQVLSGNHPDLIRFGAGRHISQESKDSNKEGIAVGDIREAVRIAGTHTYEGGCRVFLLDQAESMTPQAQNSLLKTLEEPIDGTVFLLVTDSPSLLLPTIVSRCRRLNLHAWPDETIRALLQKRGIAASTQAGVLRSCGGSIGRALEIASDTAYWETRTQVMTDFLALSGRSEIMKVSGKYKDAKNKHEELLDTVEELIHTLMLVRLGRAPAEAAEPYPAAWKNMAAKGEPADFMRLLDAVSEARRLRLSQTTWQAVLERLLLHLMEERDRWST